MSNALAYAQRIPEEWTLTLPTTLGQYIPLWPSRWVDKPGSNQRPIPNKCPIDVIFLPFFIVDGVDAAGAAVNGQCIRITTDRGLAGAVYETQRIDARDVAFVQRWMNVIYHPSSNIWVGPDENSLGAKLTVKGFGNILKVGCVP